MVSGWEGNSALGTWHEDRTIQQGHSFSHESFLVFNQPSNSASWLTARRKLETKIYGSSVALCISDQFGPIPWIFSFAPLQQQSWGTQWALCRCAGLYDPGSYQPTVCQAPRLLFEGRNQQKEPQVARRINVMKIAPFNILSSVIFVHRIYILPCTPMRHVRIIHTRINIYFQLEKTTRFWS